MEYIRSDTETDKKEMIHTYAMKRRKEKRRETETERRPARRTGYSGVGTLSEQAKKSVIIKTPRTGTAGPKPATARTRESTADTVEDLAHGYSRQQTQHTFHIDAFADNLA